MDTTGRFTVLALWLLAIVSLVSAVRVHDDTPIDCNTPAPGSQYCVDVAINESVCTSDPMIVSGLRVDHDVNPGVEQRIDGTEAEQNSIKAVLRLMNRYWYDEVLSNIDYIDVRSSCKNRNTLCAFWAAIGECESNREFMLPNCAPACRICLLLHTNLGRSKDE